MLYVKIKIFLKVLSPLFVINNKQYFTMRYLQRHRYLVLINLFCLKASVLFMLFIN